MEQSTQPEAVKPETTPPNPIQPPVEVLPAASAVETVEAQEQPAENLLPGIEATPEPEQPQPSTAGKILNWLFGPLTPVGKVMRPLLRWTALVEGLLAIGLLIGFFFLYMPTQAKLEEAQKSLSAANIELSQSKVDLAAAEQTIADQQSGLIRAQTLQVVYQLKDSVSTVRLDLVNKQGPKAKTDLENAQNTMNQLVRLVKNSEYAAAVDLVQTRMKLVTDEYAVDAVQAQKDLEIIYSQLGEIEKTLLSGE